MDCAAVYLRSGNPSATGYAQCGGYALRTISPADVEAYAQRSGAQGNNQLYFVKNCLNAGRLIYWKNTPGDCPVQTKIDLGAISTINKVGAVGLTGIGAASSGALLFTGGAGVGTSAAGSGAALGGLPAIFGTIAGPVALAMIPLAIWGAISAHHKIAVAREQATICDVSQAYDQWEQTAEYAIANGQMIASDVKAALPQVELQLMQALQAIMKQCDAACFMQKALKALDLYAVEKLYDSLSPQAQIISNPANPAQPVNPTKAASKNPFTTYGIAGLGALASVKAIGALA